MALLDKIFTVEIRERINEAVALEPGLSRVQLSRRVCEWTNWRDATGRLKEVSCRVALLKLQRRGLIPLPTVLKSLPRRMKRPINTVIAHGEAASICCALQELGEVE